VHISSTFSNPDSQIRHCPNPHVHPNKRTRERPHLDSRDGLRLVPCHCLSSRRTPGTGPARGSAVNRQRLPLYPFPLARRGREGRARVWASTPALILCLRHHRHSEGHDHLVKRAADLQGLREVAAGEAGWDELSQRPVSAECRCWFGGRAGSRVRRRHRYREPPTAPRDTDSGKDVCR
jgi:hypothetical protein